MPCNLPKLAIPRAEPAADPGPAAPIASTGGLPAVRTRHRGITDCGLCRAHNEDAFFADERLGLFLVCDGVGGRAFGEVAAAMTAEIISNQIREALDDASHAATWTLDAIERVGELIRSAMQRASRELRELAAAHPPYLGMATTATVALVRDGWAVVGQVGDSRAYHAHGPAIRQLTEDHTLLNEQVLHGYLSPEHARGRPSPITRAIGLRDSVEVDITASPLRAGDRLLLCTDGLHGYLDGTLLQKLFQMDVHDAAPAAIHHANNRGGKDNITAIFVEVV